MADGIAGTGVTLAGDATGSIGMIRSVSVGGTDTTKVDITTTSDEFKKYVSGQKEPGEITVEMLYDKTNYDAILDAWIAGDTEEFTVTFADGSTWVSDGFISSGGNVSAPQDGEMPHDLTIKLSGSPTFTAGS